MPKLYRTLLLALAVAAPACAQDFKESDDAAPAAKTAAKPAKPGEAASGLQEGGPTVVCDGKGGYRVAMAGKEILPHGGCLRVHEESHIEDFKKTCPDGCKGQPDGKEHPLTGERCAAFAGEDAFFDWRKPSECKAYSAELACLRAQYKTDEKHKGLLRARIHDVRCSLTYWKCGTGQELDKLKCQ